MKNRPGRSPLKPPKTAKELLDMYFLDIRSALLEVAAGLDRIERAHSEGDVFEDPRLEKLFDACEIIRKGKKNRAEQFLTLFSEPAN